MKNNITKKITALFLCLSMVFGTAVLSFAAKSEPTATVVSGENTSTKEETTTIFNWENTTKDPFDPNQHDWGTESTTKKESFSFDFKYDYSTTKKDLYDLVRFAMKLAFSTEMSDDDIDNLIKYTKGGGKLGDWLREKKNINPGGEIYENLVLGTVVTAINAYNAKYHPGETTTKSDDAETTTRYEFDPDTLPTETTTVHVFIPKESTTRGSGSTEKTTKKPTTTKKPATAVRGDVNGNGIVTSEDARTTLRAAARLEVLSSKQKKIADIDGDGFITSGDARTILRIAAKLE